MSQTVEERVARLEGRVDEQRDRTSALERDQRAHSADDAREFSALHNRVTRIEVRVAYYAGGAAAIGGLVGTILGYVTTRGIGP